MAASYSVSGSYSATEAFLKQMSKVNTSFRKAVEPIAKQGVSALAAATPVETGRAAQSWGYEIVETKGGLTVWWTNDDIENGFPVAIMAQLGHGTKNGGYVQGRDYINPALRPIFDKITDEILRVVNSA